MADAKKREKKPFHKHMGLKFWQLREHHSLIS